MIKRTADAACVRHGYTAEQQAKFDLLTREMRLEVADCIKRDNLEKVNRLHAPVTPRRSLYSRFVKRGIDIVVSAFALVVTFPINVVLCMGTALDVGRPIIFKQRRTGKDGKPFYIIKFRNMTNEKDENGELLPARDRITKFGAFVRKTSLDELLNFWSIFKGDMSLVGPRPLKAETAGRFSNRHASRMAVRPGLECPILHDFGYAPGWDERLENDVWYVEHVSLVTDIRMLLGVVRMTFDAKARKYRASASGGGFMGYDPEGHAIDQASIPEKYLDEVLHRHGLLDKN